ncbi:MAG: hypothetical protein WCC40_10280, partial [Rhodomicrobium sp.]
MDETRVRAERPAEPRRPETHPGAPETKPVKPAELQVVSGLSAGDRVVTDGADRLRNGAKVTIVNSGDVAPPGSGLP